MVKKTTRESKPDDDSGTHEDSEGPENDFAEVVIIRNAQDNELDNTADAEKQLDDARPDKVEIQPSATPVAKEEAVEERRLLRLARIVARGVGPPLCTHTLGFVAQPVSAFLVQRACCAFRNDTTRLQAKVQ